MSETKKPWCDGPYELLSIERAGGKPGEKLEGTQKLAKEMILVHNIMIRGINCVQLQALNVSQKGTAQDKLDFANFAYQWAKTLHHHHNLEEELVFPRFAEAAGDPSLLQGPVEEHREFDEGLKRYETYLEAVKEEKEELDGEKLLAIMDEVMPVVYKHLSHEIDAMLDLKKYDKVDWVPIFEEVVGGSATKDMKQSAYRNDLFPLVLHLHDKTFESGAFADFPPVPWLVLVAIQWIFCRTRASWWRFSGCDANSNPQELPFA